MKNQFYKWIVVLIIVCIQFVHIASEEKSPNRQKQVREDCTDVARDDETLLVFSTLGGGLTAIDPITSEVRWKIEDEPAIKVPTSSDNPVPQYLPDPRDGTLYQLGGMGGLKKLPYTIPQLVASAPCRSSDGILYSGKKKDIWFLIDPKTGKREKVLGFGAPNTDSIGWATSRAIYLGRTQYTVLMYDSLPKNDKKSTPWNVTFYDYSSITMAPELYQSYEWLHLTSSSSGLTATLDRSKGTLLWQKDVASPVVAVFLLGPDGLLSIPFTTLSEEALQNIVDYAKEGAKSDFKFFQTLYVGEHLSGLYAIPSLVDKNTATISSEPSIKLIDGPDFDKNTVQHQNLIHLNNLFGQKTNENNIIVLGFYQPPPIDTDLKLSLSSKNSAIDNDKNNIATMIDIFDDPNKVIQSQEMVHTEEVVEGSNTTNPILDKGSKTKTFLTNFYHRSKLFINDQENRILKMLLIILTVMIVCLFWYTRNAVRELRQQSQNGSKTGGRGGANDYHDLEDMGEGEMKVGKICFKPNDVIGKGCEGTFVFKGTFEKRDVAVKRLLPECFTLADREVSLLRESDTHENVVRYFCTEQDRQFRYIAVELCAATLQDFTEGARVQELRVQISELDVLRQSTKGLIHLHSLNIVHRDIKPQNVLLSFPDTHNRVRVMISDFGLCKKLNVGKASFSRRSGITGTEGWIAPEMLKGQRTTTSVDIFSLGCVFYYILSKGQHPFGEPMRRQSNILSNEYDLKAIVPLAKSTNGEILSAELIGDMISHNPNQRPTAASIRNHPLFWSEERILAFLQDVSDRVEKTNPSFTEPLRRLEKNANLVVRGDWGQHLDHNFTSDMKKYRGYQGTSVRDLLRAIRNKKHHYHELEPELQATLGGLPVDFTRFWLKRFPHLLSHSYHALKTCAKEESFKLYYTQNYAFTAPSYFDEPGLEESFESLMDMIANSSPKKNSDKSPRPQNYTRKAIENNYVRQRKGAYNFHKTEGGNDFGSGLMPRKTKRKNSGANEAMPNQNTELNWTLHND